MRKRVTCAAALCVALLGCKKKEAAPPPPEEPKVIEPKAPEPPPAKKPLSGDEIAAKFKECMAIFSSHDEARFAATCFSDTTVTDIVDSGMPPTTGGKAAAERAREFWTGIPDTRIEPQLTLVSGDNFASIDLFTGTNTGELMGKPPTGKKVGYYMTHFGAIDQSTGVPSKVNGLFDMATMMGQVSGDKTAAKVVDKGWPEPGKVIVATGAPAEAANVELWNKGTEGWNAHDAAKALADYADDAVFHDAGMGEIKGKKAITDIMKAYWAGFPDIKGTYDSVWGAGDWLFASAIVSGTNDGDLPMMKLKKTGKTVTMRTAEIVRIEGGKVKEHWIFYNGLAMAMQLGLVPPPEGAPNPKQKT
jgi:predicted ester cyclase